MLTIAGQLLFQRDRPALAWEYLLKPSLHIVRPSIAEYLLAANCLLQGLGRYSDAVALLARANESNAREAAKLGLANTPFRVLDSVWARHIGHLGILDYVLKLGILEGRRRSDTVLYLPPGSHLANSFLVEQLASQLRLVENPVDLPIPASAVQALHFDLMAPRLSDHTTAYYWNIAAETYARWHRESRSPLFAFPSDLASRGWATLRQAGIPTGSWFVALHVRECEPDGRKSGINVVRNADLLTYLPAIDEITRRGGWVIRLGDPGMTPLPPLANVFDYCRSPLRSDWMDIFILACCRFMVATNSGPAFVPALYGTPAVMTNWWPAAERPWHPSDIFVPKLLRKLSDDSYLTLTETLREPLCWCYSRRYLAGHAGVRVENNDPEMIRAAVEEMLNALEDNRDQDDATAQLRERADQIYQTSGVAGMARLPGKFLHRHERLIA